MATLNDYKGLEVVEDATGDGGIALTDNFKELADRAPYQAAVNPGVSDDSAAGFSPGDQWLNTSTQVLWACVSNTYGSAVWRSIFKRTSAELVLTPEEASSDARVVSKSLAVSMNGAFPTGSVGILNVQALENNYAMRIENSSTGGSTWFMGPTNNGFAAGGGKFVMVPNAAASEYSVLAITTGGLVGLGVGNNTPTAPLDVSGNAIRLRSSKTPSSSTASGNQGDICWDDDYAYVCVAANTWKRSPLSTW